MHLIEDSEFCNHRIEHKVGNEMIKNVIFDMGNVLLDYNPLIPLTKFVDKEEDRAIIQKELFESVEWVQMDLGELSREQAYETIKARIPKTLHKALHDCIYHWQICMTALEGAKEFVTKVKEQGLGVYVLSNASEVFYEYFPEFLPLEYFDGIVVSADVHMVKPDIKIYQFLLERYGLKAEECLFIDDRVPNVIAAIASGMQGVVFKGNFKEIKI